MAEHSRSEDRRPASLASPSSRRAACHLSALSTIDQMGYWREEQMSLSTLLYFWVGGRDQLNRYRRWCDL
eukprot:6384235-Pyramimonas_sp.AAC.1